MKNYLCINGKKTELTEKQLKQLGITIEPIATLDGDIAKIGNYEFIVLENDGIYASLLLKDTLGEDMIFGNTNDFRTSEVKKICDSFGEEIEELIGKGNLVKHTVGLMALDGLKDYGEIETKMSLLTVARYQEHIEIIEEHKLDKWWWLATAWSTPKHGYTTLVSCVSPNGRVYNNLSCDGIVGVRPFCIVKSNIFQS